MQGPQAERTGRARTFYAPPAGFWSAPLL